MNYELWHSPASNCYSLFPAEHSQTDLMVEEDAILIWVFEAEGWEDAQRKKHVFLGWEPYKPIDEN